jgi:proteasome assembly chaperone (PAC2) family protein
MKHVIFHEQPNLKRATLVAAMAGWPDAQRGATRAIRHLTRKLSARKFAELDTEEFYIFTRQRPMVRLDSQGNRTIQWPRNEFYYCHEETTAQDLLFYIGTEPQMRWKTFTSTILEVARQCDTERMIFLGSLLDAVPHTREPNITGSATHPQLKEVLEEMGIHGSGYQGPIGAPTVLMEALTRESLGYASIWAHAPHYLQGSTNPIVTHALLRRIVSMLGLQLDLTEWVQASTNFESQVNASIAAHAETLEHIHQLEARYDQATGSIPQSQSESVDLPSAEEAIKGLEEFLRGQQASNQDVDGTEPSNEHP